MNIPFPGEVQTSDNIREIVLPEDPRHIGDTQDVETDNSQEQEPKETSENE